MSTISMNDMDGHYIILPIKIRSKKIEKRDVHENHVNRIHHTIKRYTQSVSHKNDFKYPSEYSLKLPDVLYVSC